jgi:hypothetical protein
MERIIMAIEQIINDFEKETEELKSLTSKKPEEFSEAENLRIYKWIATFKELMFQTYISENNFNDLINHSQHFHNLKWMIQKAEALIPFMKKYQQELPRIQKS